MKTVKNIYDFFLQNTVNPNEVTLLDFLKTIPGFESQDSINMTLAMEYNRVCEKMAEDMLLIKTSIRQCTCLTESYMSMPKDSFTDPTMFERKMDYGCYDFKYNGFALLRNHFKDSILPIVGINSKGDEDIGSAYYIGNNMFVTAAHCVSSLDKFKLLLHDTNSLNLKEVWLPKGWSIDEYDLAIILVEDTLDLKPFMCADPLVLDDVLVIGYPPISGISPVQISEVSSVGYYSNCNQKAAVGQVVAETDSYMSKLEFFLINARVKGGNSGGPVINKEGCVIGTVVQLPFDINGGSYSGRFDIMGFGICLPSKYTDSILNNPIRKSIYKDGDFYSYSK